MLFHYKAIDASGTKKEGEIDASSEDSALNSLQRRGLIISNIIPADKKPLLQMDIDIFSRVSNKDLVVTSRQIATLFEAQISALRIFKLIAQESENKILREKFGQISDDLQGGNTISNALSQHPDIFSDFYVNLVRAGEESGRLSQTFVYLADYLDRTYEVTMKARNALIYPAFIVGTFVIVMVLMLTLVIPKLAEILLDSGQDIPIYTKIVIGASDLLLQYWGVIIFVLVAGFVAIIQFERTEEGKEVLSEFKLRAPFIGPLFEKLYLSRISDNFHTMLESGIPMVRTIELTAKVVDNRIYENILNDVVEDVRGGSTLSAALERHERIPRILVQMIRVGEESGEVGKILNTLANFYRREVTNAVDTLVDLIEPVMIVLLGLGVGTLLASILIPIYNIAGSL